MIRNIAVPAEWSRELSRLPNSTVFASPFKGIARGARQRFDFGPNCRKSGLKILPRGRICLGREGAHPIPPSNLIILRYQLYPGEQIKERNIAASLSTPNHTIVEVIQPSPVLVWGNGHNRKAIFSLAKNSEGNSRGRKGSRRSKIGVSTPRAGA